MVAALQKRPLSPWEEGLRAGKVPIILPVQSPAPPADSEEDDVETFVPRDAIFPSRHVDIDALYATEVTAATARQALRDIRLLIHDDRLIAAATLLEKLERFLATACGDDSDNTALRRELEGRMARPRVKRQLEVLRERAVECREAAEDLSSDEGWTLAVRSMGFSTYIRPMDGQWYVKVEGQQEGTSVFDQLAVVREAGLYQRWGPFVGKSAMAHKFTHLDLIVHFEIKAPLLHRDALVRGYACDYSEKDMVLIAGDVATPEDYPDLGLPPDPNGWFFGRLQIRRFRCQVQMWGVDKGKVTVAAIIDPRISLPQTVVSFAIKHIIAVLLYLILRTARRVEEEGGRPGTLGHDIIELVRRDPYYACHCLPRILWYCQRKGWAWPGHPSLPATPPANEREALALAGIGVTEGHEGGGDGEQVTRGESEASFSAASTVSSQREEELLETEEAAVAAPEPVPAAGSMDAAASGPTQKKKRFWRRLFRGRKHKQKHKQKAAAAAAARASPQPLAWAASSGGGGGKGWAAMMGKQQRQQQQQSALPPSPQRLPYLPPTAPIVTAASSAPMTAPAAASNPLSPYPITRHDAALWNLLWTLPLLVLGFLLVRAAVSPLVHAYAGAAGEALVLAVLLQHATALLARQGLLPAAVRVTLRCQLPTLVLAGSLALAALLCVLGGAWDRRMGARVRAANSGLFLLLLGLVVVGQWRAAKAEQGRSDGQSGDRMASVRA